MRVFEALNSKKGKLKRLGWPGLFSSIIHIALSLQDAAFASLISMLQSPLFNQLLNIQKSAADQNAEELQYANEDFAPKPESKLPLWLNGPINEDHAPNEPNETTAGIEKEAAIEASPKVGAWVGLGIVLFPKQ